jgi:hypothetical protein
MVVLFYFHSFSFFLHTSTKTKKDPCLGSSGAVLSEKNAEGR